ncbi:flagellar hook-length control protein FliK [Janthinobacterium sp.]|uniref:flagellar hook-length control protein FliK n=1 Tax=Janthinobacterium sp. TaxID=1871054 RepID=UPI00260DB688|nr:flagellar hook-length control protein FliK [Janthinobacterium sp.]
MKMSFNTTTSSAITPPRSAEEGVNASVSKSAPESDTARNFLFSLPAPAQRTLASDAALAQDLAADLTADGVPATDVPADITQAATTQDAGLPAMTPPLMAPMLPVSPQADAAAAAAKGNAGVAATQQGNALQTLDLNSRLHPDGLAFNVQTARMAPARDLGAPVAAAQPTPASAAGSKTALPAAGFDAAPAMTATPAAVAPAATRDGERGAATPVSPGPAGGVHNGAAATPGAETIKLNGPAQQWQEPLREALGERLQTQIGRNSEHATIRLDPPMLGRIEISIRHTAGALQVNVTASNSEVLRQLQGIGENMRSDLAQRQYTDVAVTISATPRSPAAQAFAEGDARGQRQPGRQNDDAEPGRALSDGSTAATTYAMHERDTA